MSKSKSAWLILGNQLFEPKYLQKSSDAKLVFMQEHSDLASYFKFHKIKIAFFLSSMRHYASELKSAGYKTTYHEISETEKTKSFFVNLSAFIKDEKISKLVCFEIEDKFFESAVLKFASDHGLELQIIQSPMFLTSRADFKAYLGKSKKPFMKTFYEGQRKKLKILVTADLKPIGGKFSYDEDNRERLPKDITPPTPVRIKQDSVSEKVFKDVDVFFPDHPGDLKNFWLPTTRKDSEIWLKDFLKNRFNDFGPYEDALTVNSDFVYHSAISPMINIGLLTPDQVVKEALAAYKNGKATLASTEGFLRQIIGWREFIRGIYQNFSEKQENSNFFGHKRKLTSAWYEGTTGIPPLDHAIQKTDRLGYSHHIERLMVLSNLMNLCEVDPVEVHKWFMEMFVDSSDWVMGPNVYGMGLFSDGGIFATKPYTCGSNYYLKMSYDYKKGDWCDIVDGLYWRFIDKHKSFYAKNPRMNMMVKSLEKMDSDRKERIFKAAEAFIKKVTE
jgi:deoxyribodipyrimidine photolyase-related protein